MIVRRMFEDHGQQVFVEYDSENGSMHVAHRVKEWDVWSPPMVQVRKEDEDPNN